jgi:hypothetical protein
MRGSAPNQRHERVDAQREGEKGMSVIMSLVFKDLKLQ